MTEPRKPVKRSSRPEGAGRGSTPREGASSPQELTTAVGDAVRQAGRIGFDAGVGVEPEYVTALEAGIRRVIKAAVEYGVNKQVGEELAHLEMILRSEND